MFYGLNAFPVTETDITNQPGRITSWFHPVFTHYGTHEGRGVSLFMLDIPHQYPMHVWHVCMYYYLCSGENFVISVTISVVSYFYIYYKRQQQPPPQFYGHFTGSLYIGHHLQLWTGGFCCSKVLLPHASQSIQIRKKSLEFSSTVLTTLSPYTHTLV